MPTLFQRQIGLKIYHISVVSKRLTKCDVDDYSHNLVTGKTLLSFH